MNIRQKFIILLLLIGLIPTLIVSAIAYAIISNNLNNDTINQLVSIATKQEQKIGTISQKKQEEVIKLANTYDFQVALSRFLASNSKADHDNILTIFRDKKTAVPEIQAVHVTDLKNEVIVSTISGTEGTMMGNVASLQSGADTLVTVAQDPQDNINKLYITSRVSIDKKDVAILVVVFRVEDIVAAVQDYTGLDSTGETMVLSKNGSNDGAISLFPLRFNTEAALKTKPNQKLFVGTDTVFNDLTDYRGKQVMAAARPTSFSDWVIVTKIDREEAFEPNLDLAKTLLAIVLGSSVLIVIVALLFTRLFTEPILRIAKASQQIGRGDFSVRLDIRRKDELGSLGQSINAMGMSLQTFVSDIQSQRNRLETVLDSIEESILALDKQGVIIIANHIASNLTGLVNSEIVGRKIDDVFKWSKEKNNLKINYEASGTHTYPDLEYIGPDNSTHYVRLIVTQLSGEQETSAQTIVTIRDETKSRELENMKMDFVSMAAHELRTPLAAIRGFLELIAYQTGKSISADVEKYLEQALKTIGEVGSLIDNLLDVSKIERGTLAFHLEKVDLAADLKNGVEQSVQAAKEKRIEITYSGPMSDCFIVADQLAIHEVITNLLSNAIKYTLPDGRVEVHLSQEGDNYQVSVKDNGIGIPKNALPNVFTKFYRVRGGLSSGSTGTGLGLYIAKSIVEKHGGSIKVESEEGMGSIFTYVLPLYNDQRLENMKKQNGLEQELAEGVAAV